MKKGVSFKKLDGSELKIGIAVSRWNAHYTEPLLEKCLEGLKEAEVKEENIKVIRVPGSYELPFAAHHLIDEDMDAVICIGVLIKGETMHFEYISDAVSRGIMDLQLKKGVPVVFGVLTCLTEKQAEQRSLGTHNHAREWGLSAVEMAHLG